MPAFLTARPLAPASPSCARPTAPVPLASLLWLALVGGAAALSGCSESRGAPQGGAGMLPQVSVAPAVQREVQDFDEFSGRLEAPQTVDIRARVSGAIETVHFREGQDVRKGDLLFSIDPRPYKAELARTEA